MGLENISISEVRQMARIPHMGFNKEFLEAIGPERTNYFLARKLRHNSESSETAKEILITYGPTEEVLDSLIKVYKIFPSARGNIHSLMYEFGAEYEKILENLDF
jgi:hypothetical protein